MHSFRHLGQYGFARADAAALQVFSRGRDSVRGGGGNGIGGEDLDSMHKMYRMWVGGEGREAVEEINESTRRRWITNFVSNLHNIFFSSYSYYCYCSPLYPAILHRVLLLHQINYDAFCQEILNVFHRELQILFITAKARDRWWGDML